MDNDTAKIGQLVARLLSRTDSKELKWEKFTDNRTFQTRLGNFIVILTQDTTTLNRPVLIRADRLDGSNVFAASSDIYLGQWRDNVVTNVLAGISANQLKQLYSVVTQKNSDLDELLKLV